MHPNLLHLGHLVLPTFGLLLVLGLAAALFLSLHTAVRCGLPPDPLWNTGLFAVLAAFFSSRLLLVLTNLQSFRAAPVLLLMQPSLTAGGMLLAATATLLYLRRRGLPIAPALDSWAAPAALVWAALALGHLAEGTDPGMPALHLGLRTSAAGYREVPVALFAAVLALALAALAFALTVRPHRTGTVAATTLLLGGLAQFFLGFLRLPFQYPDSSLASLLDPGQWTALLITLLGAALTLATRARPLAATPSLPAPERS